MESLDRKGNELNPDVLFDATSGNLSIKGKSIPLDVEHFLAEVTDWLELYSQNPHEHTKFEIDLKYLNGKSIRSLLSILYKLKTMNESGKNVMITWSIPKDADDIKDLSENVLTSLHIPHRIHLN